MKGGLRRGGSSVARLMSQGGSQGDPSSPPLLLSPAGSMDALSMQVRAKPHIPSFRNALLTSPHRCACCPLSFTPC